MKNRKWSLVVASALGASLLVLTPVAAQTSLPEYLTVTKGVDQTDLSPGDLYTYPIDVRCSEASCVNAELVDLFPSELAGFPILGIEAQPPATSIPRTITWQEAGVGIAQPTVMGPATSVTVDFSDDIGSGQVGLQNGATFTMRVTLQVPLDLPPGDPYDVTNTASTTADNSAPDDDSATVTIDVPVVIDVETTKTWSPTPQQFDPGRPSTITAGVTNTSNTAVDTLVLQEPTAAIDAAATLAPSNPFTITDLSALTLTPPAGTDQVQVDLYLFDGAGWNWVLGTPVAPDALPALADPAVVGGVRVTFLGTFLPNASATVALAVGQRATERNTGNDLSIAQHRVDNVVTGTASLGDASATDDATASFVVSPVTIAVAATKDISPNRISAGETVSAFLTATNASGIGVNELRVADLGFFTSKITFGGFTSAPLWPPAASSMTVRYFRLGSEVEETTTYTDPAAVPAPPSVDISGFEIVFTAPNGGIAAGSTTNIRFDIDTTEDATGAAVEITRTNTITADVTANNGVTATTVASDTLDIVTPAINVELDKTIRPSTPVEPGDSVVTSLAASLSITSEYVTPTRIVVEDAWNGTNGAFWDGFDLRSISSTQVPSDTTLTVQAQTVVDTWVPITVASSQPAPFLFSMSTAEITTALGSTPITDVTGLRFTFDKPTGLPGNTTVTPVFVTRARAVERIEPTPSAGVQTTYRNTATTTGSGVTDGGAGLEDVAADSAQAIIIIPPGGPGGPGQIAVDKAWNLPDVFAQSGLSRKTALTWKVDEGFETVTLTDPTNFADPANSVFQAFDLVGIDRINASSVPFSNGWFLKYDTIASIELYNGSTWVTVPVPAGGWVSNGRFVGYNLSTAQRASTTGVRLTLTENASARLAAQVIGANFDAFAPDPGTGVAASSAFRTFTHTWQLRNVKRVPAPPLVTEFVTNDAPYNTVDPGVVSNTVRLDAQPSINDPVTTASADDSITITAVDPLVRVAKSVTPDTPLFVPMPGTPAANYPTATFTVTANNDSFVRASYVRVTDPATCSDAAIGPCQSDGTAAAATANPFALATNWLDPGNVGNPFDRFDVTDITIAASVSSQVDLAASTVWLLRYVPDGVPGNTADDLVAEVTTAAAANALPEAQLADIIGVSVTFQGTSPATNGGTITSANNLRLTLQTRLRQTLRLTGEPQRLTAGQTVDVTNRAFAQSYDPVLNDGFQTGDVAADGIVLTGGDINVAATKSITPTTLTEPSRDRPVTATIGANQGSDPRSTLSPRQVIVRDDIVSSPEFWDHFDFTGLGSIVLPAGADRVAVDVYGPFGPGDAVGWTSATATTGAAAAVPVGASQYPDVQGIRYTFTRADGVFFSETIPAPNWNGSGAFALALRDTYRGSGLPMQFSDAAGGDVVVRNTATAQSIRSVTEFTIEKTAAANIALTPGTRQLSVQKIANNGVNLVSPGTPVPFDLVFENTGTGFLTIEELRDTLPSSLVFLDSPAPVFAPDADGLLSGDVDFIVDGNDIVFTWPDDANVMAPGESFEITLFLELQPGLSSGQQAVNTMTVQTEQTLTSCSNIGQGGLTTDAFTQDPTTCGTTDFVTPTQGPNLFTVKGVRGSLPGAVNLQNPASACTPRLVGTDGSYFRTPCVANSTIGGVDDWILRAQNAGTVTIDEMTIFDQLPVAGDRFLVSGTSRGSNYRPQIVPETVQVEAPTGTDVVIEVATTPEVCRGTWANLVNQEPCEQSGENWAIVAADTAWSNVTGLRVQLDFRSSLTGSLGPGQIVDVTFSTENVPVTDADPSGASVVVPPPVEQLAWNQFGVKYLNTGSTTFSKLSPSQVGVRLRVGAIAIEKEITGPAASYAPDEFTVDLVCSIADATIDLGDNARVTLAEAQALLFRLDSLPVGASCDITETGEVGEFGETSRSGTPVTIAVDEATGPGDPVPAAQLATIINDYQFSGLEVSKQVETDSIARDFGPFDFTLACTTSIGTDVLMNGDSTTLTFSVQGGETFVVPGGVIPVGSTCTLREADSSLADEVTISGADVIDNGDGSAIVEVGGEVAIVGVVNQFDAGTLTINKTVAGAGSALYGSGPFTFRAVCTYDTQTLLDSTLDVAPGTPNVVGPYPAGTRCVVTEVGTGGANSTTVSPTDGVVVIEAGDDGVDNVEVSATNTFDVGSAIVNKVIAGPTNFLGPFTVSLACTRQVNGVAQQIQIPGGPERILTGPSSLTATYSSLPVGANCTLTETATGDASSTSISITTGTDTVQVSGTSVSFVVSPSSVAAVSMTITNTFNQGSGLPDTGGNVTTPPIATLPDTGGGGGLPSTGGDIGQLLALAMAGLALGLMLLAVRRTRRLAA